MVTMRNSFFTLFLSFQAHLAVRASTASPSAHHHQHQHQHAKHHINNNDHGSSMVHTHEAHEVHNAESASESLKSNTNSEALAGHEHEHQSHESDNTNTNDLSKSSEKHRLLHKNTVKKPSDSEQHTQHDHPDTKKEQAPVAASKSTKETDTAESDPVDEEELNLSGNDVDDGDRDEGVHGPGDGTGDEEERGEGEVDEDPTEPSPSNATVAKPKQTAASSVSKKTHTSTKKAGPSKATTTVSDPVESDSETSEESQEPDQSSLSSSSSSYVQKNVQKKGSQHVFETDYAGHVTSVKHHNHRSSAKSELDSERRATQQKHKSYNTVTVDDGLDKKLMLTELKSILGTNASLETDLPAEVTVKSEHAEGKKCAGDYKQASTFKSNTTDNKFYVYTYDNSNSTATSKFLIFENHAAAADDAKGVTYLLHCGATTKEEFVIQGKPSEAKTLKVDKDKWGIVDTAVDLSTLANAPTMPTTDLNITIEIAPKTADEESKEDNTKMYIIIGAAAGGGLLLVGIGYYMYTKNQSYEDW